MSIRAIIAVDLCCFLFFPRFVLFVAQFDSLQLLHDVRDLSL